MLKGLILDKVVPKVWLAAGLKEEMTTQEKRNLKKLKIVTTLKTCLTEQTI